MKRFKIKKIILAILTLQIVLYFLLGDFMLEKQILNEFEEFSDRRLASKYNIENAEVYEQFLFSSCGDEFFRDEERLKEVIKNSNLNRYEKLAKMEEEFEVIMMSEDDEDFNPILIRKSEYYDGILNLHYENVGKKNEINVIGFGACRINRIPFISTKIQLKESFSTHTDFHSMRYTGQMISYKIKYIWILFKWVRISKKMEKF